ncbi:MAG: hypothetical protein K2X26_09250 [Chitinophagaceae bacterium]|jgi:hypothetical protein|nr:hypothetical protein [Chitinophagaceae bacterium]
MKKLIFFAFSLVFTNWMNAQCNTTVSTEGDARISQAKYEQFHKNEDLENGLQALYISVIYIKKPSQTSLFIEVVSTKSHNKELVVPRKLIFNFTDGSSLDLIADKYDKPNMNSPLPRYSADRCSFTLNSGDKPILANKSISTITVIDTRTSASIVAKPFKGLVQEQIGCVIRDAM